MKNIFLLALLLTTQVFGALTSPVPGSLVTSTGQGAGLTLVSDGAGNMVFSAAGSGTVSTAASVGASPNANGMTITGANINLQPADASFPGVVTTGAQEFSGDKTFRAGVLDIRITGAEDPTPYTGAALDISGTSTRKMVVNQIFSNTASAGPSYTAFRHRGTVAAPLAISSGDKMFDLWSFGRFGTLTNDIAGYNIMAVTATENWGASARGFNIVFANIANGTTSLATRLTLEDAGEVRIHSGSLKISAADEGITVGANAVPNTGVEVDLRGGSGDAVIQLSDTTSGSALTDGTLITHNGVDLTINNQEAGYVGVSTTGTERFRVSSGGAVSMPGSQVIGAAVGTAPNYELDVRGGAGNSTLQQTNDPSGTGAGDGVIYDFDGTNLTIDNQEDGNFAFNGTEIVVNAPTGSSGSVTINADGTNSAYIVFTNTVNTPGISLETDGTFQVDAGASGFPMSLLTADAGVDLNTTGTKPTCNSSRRGQVFFEEGATLVADLLLMCMKNAADAYSWNTVHTAL